MSMENDFNDFPIFYYKNEKILNCRGVILYLKTCEDHFNSKYTFQTLELIIKSLIQ